MEPTEEGERKKTHVALFLQCDTSKDVKMSLKSALKIDGNMTGNHKM